MTIAIILIVGILLLCLPFHKEVYYKYSALVFILASAFYFFYNPPSQDDLYRHYQLLDNIRNYDLGFFDNTNHYWVENPLYVIYLTLVSIFPINAFLPFSVGVVYYLTCLYGIKLASIKNGEIRREMLATIVLLMTVNYISISGIRNFLGCALFLMGMYMDLILNEKKGYIFYVLGALIHSSIFLYIFIRMLLIVYKGKMKYIVLAIAFVLPFIFVNYSNLFFSLFSGIPLLAGAISRFQIYGVEDLGMEISNNWRLFTAFTYIFLYFIAFLYHKYYDETNSYNKIFNFLTLLLIIAFGFWGQRELFSRHLIIVLPLGIMSFVLLKNSSFISFPRVALVGKSGLSFQCIAPFTCLAFVAWALLYFLIMIIFYYPDFSGNFIIM